MTENNLSYGALAKQVGYGAPAEPGQSDISWLENDELQHLAEPQWFAFLLAFRLPTDTMPSKIVPPHLAASIIEAAELDPGAEKPWTFQDSLDELTSDAMTKMHRETTQALTAGLLGLGTHGDVATLVDSIMGRCSPIVQRMALDAYNLHR